MKGKRDVTVNNVMTVVDKFNINAEYLLAGIEPMFKDEEIIHKPIREDKILYVPIAIANCLEEEIIFSSLSLSWHSMNRCVTMLGM